MGDLVVSGSGAALKQFGSVIAEEAEEGVVDPEIVGSSFGSAGVDAEALGSSAAIGVADGGEDLVVSGSGAALKQFGSVIAEEAEEGVVDPEIVGRSFGSAGVDAE